MLLSKLVTLKVTFRQKAYGRQLHFMYLALQVPGNGFAYLKRAKQGQQVPGLQVKSRELTEKVPCS